jgi:hypothetical protein
MHRSFSVMIVAFVWGGALAGGHALDGAPVSLNRAQNWCVSQVGPLPNWDSPAHPDCKMAWRVLAERDGRILYSARYAWPSASRSDEPLRVLTEVLYEGIPGSRVVRRLYAVQDDEAHVRLAPLRVVTIGSASIVDSQVCMSGTGECGRELALWTNGRLEPIEDLTVAEIRAQLPKDFDVRMNPEIDLSSMSGSGKAWAKRDADCCPSAGIEFMLRLEARALHVGEMKFQRHPD